MDMGMARSTHEDRLALVQIANHRTMTLDQPLPLDECFMFRKASNPLVAEHEWIDHATISFTSTDIRALRNIQGRADSWYRPI
jgi:ribonuclease D